MARALVLVPLLLLCACAGGRQQVAVTGTTARSPAAAQQLTPQQIADGLDDLAVRVRERVNGTADRIDEGGDNALRRRTLRFRMRASEVVWRAQQNPNKLAGMVELWFWMAVVDRFARSDRALAQYGEAKVASLRRLGRSLREDIEAFARQALPERGFEAMRTRIDEAASNGEVLTATAQQEQEIIGDLLEATKLQAVLGIALSPFEALRGIGSGADSIASLVLTADRAVDLLARYPEMIAWNLRLAVIDMEEQDTAREAREALQQTVRLAERLPAAVAAEAQAVLAASGPALQQAQDTLREATEAAAALTALSASLRQTVAAVQELLPAPGPAGAPAAEPGRPFDIREYAAAIQAAEGALREARGAIAAAAEQGPPAADAAAARLEAAADRILLRVAALLAFAAALAAGLVVLHRRLGRRG